MTGYSLSLTNTVKEQTAVAPSESVTLKVLVVNPIGKVLPEGRPAICVVTAPLQLSDPVGAV